ncbi:MAG: TIGR01777 family oxidoreductase [Bacteroidota bacterium]
MLKIVLAGGTGLVGSNLLTKLKQKNYNVVLLTTSPNKANDVDTFYWNPYHAQFPEHVLSDADIVINLSGAAIFDKRFTKKRKKELWDSRTIPNENLLLYFKNRINKVSHFISASATGYYPNVCLLPLNENSTKGTNYVSDLVEAWEKSAQNFTTLGCKVSIVRIGIVFSNKGGFLQKLIQPMRYWLGAVPGDGRQIISWIHVDDLSALIIHMIENKIEGTYNATADEPTSLQIISEQAAKSIHRKLLLPNIPVFILKLLFGKRYELLLTSQHVDNSKIKASGFKFKFISTQQAIDHLYS